MKAELRISIKDYHENKSLKILLFRPPFPCRQFLVQMNGVPWPATGGLVLRSNTAEGGLMPLTRLGDGLAQVPGEGLPPWLTSIALTRLSNQTQAALAR